MGYRESWRRRSVTNLKADGSGEGVTSSELVGPAGEKCDVDVGGAQSSKNRIQLGACCGRIVDYRPGLETSDVRASDTWAGCTSHSRRSLAHPVNVHPAAEIVQLAM